MAGRTRRVDEALERGAEHHRAGRWHEAAAAYAEALRADPDNVDAFALLGGALLRMDRDADALAALDRAVALDASHALAQLNRGRALLAVGRPADAVGAFDAALAARPGFREAALGRARALLATGRAEEAVAALEGVVDTVSGAALLGAALLEAGRPREAESALRRVLAVSPDDARLHVDLGAVLVAQDRLVEAATAWDTAARLAPDLPGLAVRRQAVARAIGLARLAAGDPAAVAWLRRALAFADPSSPTLSSPTLSSPTPSSPAPSSPAPAAPAPAEDRAALAGLADAIFQHPTHAERGDLERLLAVDGVDHQRLARGAERLLGPELLGGTWAARRPDGLAADRSPVVLSPLLRAWLVRAVVIGPDWLPALRAIRRAAMAWARSDVASNEPSGAPSAAPSAEALATLEALAIQAWNTEYADVGPEDDALAASLATGPATPARLAAFALSRPLSEWPGVATLALDAPGWERRPLAALVRRQLVEPAAERALAAALPALPPAAPVGAAGPDATSEAVRAQYEENPYPRLVGVHRRAPAPFVEWLRAVIPGAPLPAATWSPARVLVAGGGTGQHPLGVASSLADAEVVAVDLSRASLARAARLARDHRVANVSFVQGDLLALGPDDGLGRFDLVDCVGVLHHLADPLAGGRALVSKLAPAGLLRLGLYSERGRADVVAARRLVAEHGWEPTPDGLRAARAALLALPPGHPAAGLAASVDLYSQSGLRDLVFHPCEHRYTPVGVGELVAALGLRVLALQHARPEPARLYRARWPDDAAQADLARWDALEAEHPRLFAGMIHVWCRRHG